MELGSFLNRHSGETAWVFGKGPSLQGFDFSKAGKIRLAINDVIQRVPSCLYGVSCDSAERWVDVYKAGQVLFQPRRIAREFDPRGKAACEVCFFNESPEPARISEGRESIAESLAVLRGSLGAALQILHVMGIAKVICVGIDGGNSHAPGDWRTTLKRDHFKAYNAIRDCAIRSAPIMGIELLFVTENQTMSDGLKTIKLLRSCFADGEPLTEGEIKAIAPKTAQELIDLGSAIPWEAPVKQERETAAAKPKETADLPKAKGK